MHVVTHHEPIPAKPPCGVRPSLEAVPSGRWGLPLDVICEVLRASRESILLVDHEGALLAASESGQTLLCADRGLRMQGSRVAPVCQRDRGNFHALLSEPAGSAIGVRSMVVRRDLGTPPLYLEVGPWLSRVAGDDGRELTLFCVSIVDVEAPLKFLSGRLQSMFDLTDRESEVAHCLVQGCSGVEIAESFSIGRETVRSHIKALFAKTHTHRQAELVRLLVMSVR